MDDETYYTIKRTTDHMYLWYDMRWSKFHAASFTYEEAWDIAQNLNDPVEIVQEKTYA